MGADDLEGGNVPCRKDVKVEIKGADEKYFLTPCSAQARKEFFTPFILYAIRVMISRFETKNERQNTGIL
jgi:hypothetical protein